MSHLNQFPDQMRREVKNTCVAPLQQKMATCLLHDTRVVLVSYLIAAHSFIIATHYPLTDEEKRKNANLWLGFMTGMVIGFHI